MWPALESTGLPWRVASATRTATARYVMAISVLLVITTTQSAVQATVYSEYRSDDVQNLSSILVRKQELLLGARNLILLLDGRTLKEISRKTLVPRSEMPDDEPLENYVRIAPIGGENDSGNRFLSCETNKDEGICRVLPYTLDVSTGADMQQSMISDQNDNDRVYTVNPTQLLFNNVLLGSRPLVRTPKDRGADVDIYVGGPYGTNTDIGIVRVPFGRQERKIDYSPKLGFAPTASFVAAFELDSSVYMFLRETAYEAGVGDTVPIYARVVRVCKADCGTEVNVGALPVYRWSSMVKVRLLCSALPRVADSEDTRVSDRFTVASAPLEFNYLHHVTFDEANDLFYATFTTITPDAPKSLASVDSAVCAYSREAIMKGFENPYLVDDNSNAGRFSWSVNRSAPLPEQCPRSRNYSCEPPANNKRFRREVASREQRRTRLLLAGAIEPDRKQPLVLAEATRFNQLATHTFTINGTRFTMLYVFGFDLVLRKYVVREFSTKVSYYADSDSCLLETFDVGLAMRLEPDVNRNTPLYRPTAFRIYADGNGEQRWLVATLSDRLVRVAASDCASLTDSTACVSSRDVLCGWSSSLGRCASLSRFNDANWDKTTLLLALATNRTEACRQVSQTRVDWSPWSPWETCNREVKGVQRPCQCRTRRCQRLATSTDKWRAAYSELDEEPVEVEDCSGAAVEVRNCAADGGWSAWSAWSPCPSDTQCRQGSTTQQRTRTCTNPAPQFAGSPCVGDTTEQRLCNCAQAPHVSYTYSDWSAWQSTPLAHFSAVVQQCAVTAEKGLNYTITLVSRTRSCQLDVSGSELSATYDVAATCPNVFESRLCLTAASQEALCTPVPESARSTRSNQRVGVSDWSTWSSCSGTCAFGGLQLRARACAFPSDFANMSAIYFDRLRSRFCDVPLIESRSCKLENCPAQSNVSMATCWSDWSACYQLPDGRNVRNRTRSCVLLREAERMPDILSYSNEKLEEYRVACPPGIATVESINCSLGFASLPFSSADQSVDAQMLDSRKAPVVDASPSLLIITSAIALVVGLAIGFLIAVVVSRAAHSDPNANCARRVTSLLCGPTVLHVNAEPDGKIPPASPSYDVAQAPSALRFSALSAQRYTGRRSESSGSEPPQPPLPHVIGTMRCDSNQTTDSRCEPRANVPLPPLPLGEQSQIDMDAQARQLRGGSSSSAVDRPGSKTPKRHRPAPLQLMQGNVMMNNGEQLDSPPAIYTSSAYSSISSEHDPQLAAGSQLYRAPVSPTKRTPQLPERARLFVNSPLPAADHEAMRVDASGAPLHRSDLQTPTRISKLANPSLSRMPANPTCVVPPYTTQMSSNDSQYAVPSVVLSNMDTLRSNGTMHSGMPGRVNAFTLTNTSGVSSLASTLHTRTIGGRANTPLTLSRPKFRAASVSSANADDDSADVNEQMRQITKLLRDDGEAV